MDSEIRQKAISLITRKTRYSNRKESDTLDPRKERQIGTLASQWCNEDNIVDYNIVDVK